MQVPQGVRERVERGAKLLDYNYPWWESKISVDWLDMSNPRLCVLGQAFGTFEIGLSRLSLSNQDVAPMGFDFPDRDASMFTEAWRQLIIQKRRTAAKSN